MDFLPSLERRERVPEIMDEPGLDRVAHRTALADLARINRLSLSADILWPSLRALARKVPSLQVLDVATGGGDVPIRLWRRARRAGLNITLHGCDISPTALDVARANAERARAPIEFFPHDILIGPPRQTYDVVMCSLFLHHLAEGEAVAVLKSMRTSATQLVLANDLDRSRIGYALARACTYLLSRSPIVRFDGPVSVRAAFTPAEARSLACEAGLKDVRVGRRWPFRFLLTGKTR